MRFLVLFVFVGISGCSSAPTEYVYTRQEPAAGRRSPTTFTVRVRPNPSNGTVVWLEDVRDKDGDLGRNMRTLKDCTILDDTNWNCEPTFVEGQGIVDHVQMRDGKLTHLYWKEQREYKGRRRLFGIKF